MKTDNEKRDGGIVGKMLIVITVIVFALFACSVDSLFESDFTQVTGVMTAILIGVCLWVRPDYGDYNGEDDTDDDDI